HHRRAVVEARLGPRLLRRPRALNEAADLVGVHVRQVRDGLARRRALDRECPTVPASVPGDVHGLLLDGRHARPPGCAPASAPARRYADSKPPIPYTESSTRSITAGGTGRSRASVSCDSIASTASMPEVTWPKTVCLPSSHGAASVVTMKNWLPFVFGPALAMASAPRTTLCWLNSSSKV